MPGIPETDRLRRVALGIWATIGGILLLAAFWWLAAQIRIIWIPLAFAIGLVVLLDPIVRGLQRIAIPRVIGAVFAFTVFIASVVAVGFLVVPVVQEQATEFADRLPALYDETVDWLRDAGDQLGVDLGPVWTSETIQNWIQDPANQETIQQLIGGFGSGAGRVLAGVAEFVVIAILAPVLAFYMLLDAPRSRRMLLGLTPPRLRDEVAHVTSQVGTAVAGFVRGQLLVAIIVGVLSSVGLWALDLPFWLIIGMAAGLLNLVPFIGPFVGGGLALIVGLVDGEPTKAVLAVLMFTAIQQVDNHIITPMVQRTRVRLSPLVIVIALLIGGSVAGLLGVLIAVPAVGVLRIVAGHLWRTRVLGESWAQATEAMIETTEPPDRLKVRRRKVPVNQARLFDTGEVQVLQDDEASPSGPSEERTPGR